MHHGAGFDTVYIVADPAAGAAQHDDSQPEKPGKPGGAGLSRCGLGMVDAELPESDRELDEILAGDHRDVVSLLQRIQVHFGFLPANVLRIASEVSGIPLARMYGVASFYTGFSLEPRGDTTIKVCKGTACHVGGAERIIEALELRLGISAGMTTEDLSFTLDTAGCLGCCSLAPVMAVGADIHGRLDKKSATEVVDRLANQGEAQ